MIKYSTWTWQGLNEELINIHSIKMQVEDDIDLDQAW